MGKPKAPTPPDPKVTIPEQTKSNVQTAVATAGLDAVNSVSPYGKVQYDITGHQNVGGQDVPQYTQTTTLSPEQQHLYDAMTGVQQKALDTAGTSFGNVQNKLAQPFTLDGIPQIHGVNDLEGDRKRVEDAYMGRFNEDFGRNKEDTISRLNAEGLQRGSAAYDTAMTGLDRQQNDARNLAIQAGGQEQSRLFGLEGQARQQGVNEAQLMRSQPVNEMATLLGSGGNIQTPTAAPNFGVNVNPTDVLGAYGMQMQGQMNNYNQKMGANSALWSGLMNLGGKVGSAAIMA